MSLHAIEVARIGKGYIAASAVSDYGDCTPILPGDFPWRALRALMPESHRLLVSLPASPRHEIGCTYGGLTPVSALRTPGIFGRGIVLATLDDAVAPGWFETNEVRAGCILPEGSIGDLRALLVRRHRLRELMEVVTAQFEYFTTSTLMLRSAKLGEWFIQHALVESARRLGFPIRIDGAFFVSLWGPGGGSRSSRGRTVAGPDGCGAPVLFDGHTRPLG